MHYQVNCRVRLQFVRRQLICLINQALCEVSIVIQRLNALPAPVRFALTLMIAGTGGVVARRLGVPLPWLLGAFFFVAVISLFGVKTGLTDHVRKAGQVMAGTSVGLFFTPAVALHVLEIGWLMVVTSLLSVLASVGIALLLARTSGCDRSTAYFAMLPGGLAEMAGLAQQFNANVVQVSLSQTLRVVVIVMLLPNLITLLEPVTQTGVLSEHKTMAPGLAALALLVGALIAWVFSRLRIFNPWLLGGLAAGVTCGLLQPEPLYAPDPIRVIAQVAIGAALGSRLVWATIRATRPSFVPLTMLATTLLITINCLVAWGLTSFVSLTTGMLAMAPGGIAEMSLTAEAMFLSPALVTAWQLVRIIVVAFLAGPLYLFYSRRMR